MLALTDARRRRYVMALAGVVATRGRGVLIGAVASDRVQPTPVVCPNRAGTRRNVWRPDSQAAAADGAPAFRLELVLLTLSDGQLLDLGARGISGSPR